MLNLFCRTAGVLAGCPVICKYRFWPYLSLGRGSRRGRPRSGRRGRALLPRKFMPGSVIDPRLLTMYFLIS